MLGATVTKQVKLGGGALWWRCLGAGPDMRAHGAVEHIRRGRPRCREDLPHVGDVGSRRNPQLGQSIVADGSTWSLVFCTANQLIGNQRSGMSQNEHFAKTCSLEHRFCARARRD